VAIGVAIKLGATRVLGMVAKIGKKMIHGALEERNLGMSGAKKIQTRALAALVPVGESPLGMVGTTQNLVLRSLGMTKLEVSHLHGTTNPTISQVTASLMRNLIAVSMGFHPRKVMTGLMTRLTTNHMKSHMTGLETKTEGDLLLVGEVEARRKRVPTPY